MPLSFEKRHLPFLTGHHQRPAGGLVGLIQTLDIITSPVGNLGAGTDPLMSSQIDANILGQVNDAFYALAEGFVSAQDGGVGDTRTLSWSYGGVTLDTRVINAVNALCFWRVELWMFRITPSGPNTAYYISKWGAWNSGVDTAPIRSFELSNNIAINHAIANTLQVTGASSDAVNGDVTQRALVVAKYPAA